MIIGVPKEIKSNEDRVSLTPAGTSILIENGHKVMVETLAGAGSGFDDAAYADAGAEITDNSNDLYKHSELILKVKEPQPSEYDLLEEGQVLFTYLHLAPDYGLTECLLKRKIVGIAYETVKDADGSLPLLAPMSQIAGRMSIQVGAQFLAKNTYGRAKGILISGVPGVPPAKVVIVGGGIVGTNAAKMAVSIGADVVIFDNNHKTLRFIDDIFNLRVKTVFSTPHNLRDAVKYADLLIGAVLLPGAKAPKLVSEDMVASMPAGSVIVDVAIDQGGCVATTDRVTTHDDPIYERYGVIHYSVANMPGAVARTSTLSLTNATLPYVLELANKGLKQAVLANIGLAMGVNVIDGYVTCKPVAEALKFDYTPLAQVLAS